MLTLESLMTVGLCSGMVSLAVHLPAVNKETYSRKGIVDTP